MLMPMKIEDGEILYTYLKVLIPNLSHRFADLARYLFAGYEAKGWRYVFETDRTEQPLEENAVGVYTFESIASNIYTTILPFVNNNGELVNGLSKFLIDEKTYELTTSDARNTVSSNSGSNTYHGSEDVNSIIEDRKMSEDAPINENIDIINSPTFKSKTEQSNDQTAEENASSSYNGNGNVSYESSKTDRMTESFQRKEDNPEYIKNYFEIRQYLVDCIKKEVEKYVYDCRLVY